MDLQTLMLVALTMAVLTPMLVYPLQTIYAANTQNEHQHLNDNKNSAHGNFGVVNNIGGGDGLHENSGGGFNVNQGGHSITHDHANTNDR